MQPLATAQGALLANFPVLIDLQFVLFAKLERIVVCKALFAWIVQLEPLGYHQALPPALCVSLDPSLPSIDLLLAIRVPQASSALAFLRRFAWIAPWARMHSHCLQLIAQAAQWGNFQTHLQLFREMPV